ncbi:MAG: nucleotidyltransferase substrate binding protein [Clostridiales bacterium]|nr:nucleotidyltransferase substrate binding protein [Clostridiales bacterium]
MKLIDYDDNWLKMLDDRNLAVHTYNEKYADDIFSRLSLYSSMLINLVNKLSS